MPIETQPAPDLASPGSGPPVDPRSVRRVLIVRPRFLGDLCLTLPVLDSVRDRCGGASVGYVVEREGAALLEGDPRVDELVIAPRNAGLAESLALVRRLRRFAPDLVIDLFCNPRTAQWSRLSGARVRVGYPNKGW
jgi:ADP-heptose:LPS heptosyltransferase